MNFPHFGSLSLIDSYMADQSKIYDLDAPKMGGLGGAGGVAAFGSLAGHEESKGGEVGESSVGLVGGDAPVEPSEVEESPEAAAEELSVVRDADAADSRKAGEILIDKNWDSEKRMGLKTMIAAKLK